MTNQVEPNKMVLHRRLLQMRRDHPVRGSAFVGALPQKARLCNPCPSRNRLREKLGLIGLTQYSMPVPSGNAHSSRPPDMTSSIAYSSARRCGYVRAIGVPNTQIFARSVSIARAPAITEHEGIRL